MNIRSKIALSACVLCGFALVSATAQDANSSNGIIVVNEGFATESGVEWLALSNVGLTYEVYGFGSAIRLWATSMIDAPSLKTKKFASLIPILTVANDDALLRQVENLLTQDKMYFVTITDDGAFIPAKINDSYIQSCADENKDNCLIMAIKNQNWEINADKAWHVLLKLPGELFRTPIDVNRALRRTSPVPGICRSETRASA